MPYAQDVKELAYTLDRVAFESYSGKPRNFKAAMDERRTKALNKAQAQIDRIEQRRRGHTLHNVGTVDELIAKMRNELCDWQCEISRLQCAYPNDPKVDAVALFADSLDEDLDGLDKKED
jgi:hypothetical protein